jgi:hypothetical protein
MRSLLLFCSVVVLTVVADAQVGVVPKNDVRLKDTPDPKFRVGDVWEYKSRSGEEHSRLTILKIEESPDLGVIVHIAVDDVVFRDCKGAPIPESIPHMPFARKAIDASVVRRSAVSQPLPNYREGYEEWKGAYTKKRAGIYVIDVGAAISVAEATYRSGIGCEEGGVAKNTLGH